MVYPIVLGAGARLFAQGWIATRLELRHHEVLGAGVVILEYRRAAS